MRVRGAETLIAAGDDGTEEEDQAGGSIRSSMQAGQQLRPDQLRPPLSLRHVPGQPLATVGLDRRDQARALVADTDADTGAQALRTAAAVRLLHNALRVDEACAAGVADLGEDSGHRVLRVVRNHGAPYWPKKSTDMVGPPGSGLCRAG